MTSPKASFLLPVYNAEKYIAQTLRSLSAQTCADFEIIAVNDGSVDSSRSILDKMAQDELRLRVIHQENSGQAAAMNRGLTECRAPYVALIDADDLCLPDRLNRQLAFMDANRDVLASGTAVRFIDSFGSPLAVEKNPTGHEDIERMLLSGIGGAIIAPSAILRRESIISVGGFAEKFSMVQDLDIYLRLGEMGRLANLAEVLVCYRKHLEAANFARRKRMVELVQAVLREAQTRRGCSLPPFALGDYETRKPSGYHQEWASLALQNGFRRSALKHACLSLWKGRFGMSELKFFKYTLSLLASHYLQEARS